jgi:hypothetical protein
MVVILPLDVKRLKFTVTIMICVPLTVVMIRTDAHMSQSPVMITMHVLIITAKQIVVVSILLSIVMIIMHVLPILVIIKQDVNIPKFHVMIRTNVLKMDVTLLLVVLTTTFHVTITTNVHLILVAQQKDAYMIKFLVMMEMLAP